VRTEKNSSRKRGMNENRGAIEKYTSVVIRLRAKSVSDEEEKNGGIA
jgi:hypothetical protein